MLERHAGLGPDDLLVILAVSEAGSISAAARALHISQPSLSRAIRLMERRVGAELFERLARGVRPTSTGAAVLEQAKLINAATSRAHRQLELTLAEGSTEAVVGIIPYISASSVARALLQFRQESGAGRLRVTTGPGNELFPALIQGDLDVVIGPLDDSPAGLTMEPLFHSRSVIVARTGSGALEGLTSPADLLERDWVLPPRGDLTRVSLERLFDDHGLPLPVPMVTCDDMPLLIYMVLHADVLTVMPHDTALSSVNRGSLEVLPIGMPATLGTIGVARRPGTTAGIGEHGFISALRTELELVGVRLIE